MLKVSASALGASTYVGIDDHRYSSRLFMRTITHASHVFHIGWHSLQVFLEWKAEQTRASRFDDEHLILSTSITKKECLGIAQLLNKFRKIDTLSVIINPRPESTVSMHSANELCLSTTKSIVRPDSFGCTSQPNYLIPGSDDEEYWKLEELLPPGLPHLRTIDVHNFFEAENVDIGDVRRMEENTFFQPWGNEIKFVEFLLRNCKKLRSMTIRSTVWNELCAPGVNFPRRSPDAHMEVKMII